MEGSSFTPQQATVEGVLEELCTLLDHLSNQLPVVICSTDKTPLWNKFQYLLHKIVEIYDQLMSDEADSNGGMSTQGHVCELPAAEHSGESEEGMVSQTGPTANKHLPFKAPVPKGRLLEIIASLHRASEGQCSNQAQLQHPNTAEAQQEVHVPPASTPTAISNVMPTFSPAHSNNTEPANGTTEQSLYIKAENDVTDFDDHARSCKQTQKISENSDLSAPPPTPISSTVNEFLKPSVRENGPPPLAPPPPPLAPPPPPPLSTPGLIVPQRVVQYAPHVPLKPLFWKRLQYSAVEVRGQDIVWSNTSEPVLEEMAQFEKLFQRKSHTVKNIKNSSDVAKQHNSSRPIRLLDRKRSQAIAIVMKSLQVDLEEIIQAVVAMETGLVDVESLKALNDMKATHEELCKIKGHLHGDSKQPLDKPDMFLYQLSLIPNLSERLSYLLFSSTFADAASSMAHKLFTLEKACHSLRHSKPLHDVLALILALGNVMNSDSKVRGQADGFHLDVLPQLMDVKATQATPIAAQSPPTITTTLLQFIVSYFVKYKFSGVASFPLPDPLAVLAASQIPFDELYSELELLSHQLGVAQLSLAVVVQDTSARQPQNLMLNNQMQKFLSQSAVRLKELSCHLSDAERLFQSTVSYFCVEAPCGEGRVNPAYFFGLWSPFLREFQQLWNVEMKNRAIARQKVAQQERWAGVVVKPVSQTGLKSRLKLLHCSNAPS